MKSPKLLHAPGEQIKQCWKWNRSFCERLQRSRSQCAWDQFSPQHLTVTMRNYCFITKSNALIWLWFELQKSTSWIHVICLITGLFVHFLVQVSFSLFCSFTLILQMWGQEFCWRKTTQRSAHVLGCIQHSNRVLWSAKRSHINNSFCQALACCLSVSLHVSHTYSQFLFHSVTVAFFLSIHSCFLQVSFFFTALPKCFAIYTSRKQHVQVVRMSVVPLVQEASLH